ncbi:MAG: Hsp20/alpha crystallin family protein, partial [Polyangiaceae bacterium]|nr:Hsp20/alpha crystallin family protein [Polyangiaceae bacterium]
MNDTLRLFDAFDRRFANAVETRTLRGDGFAKLADAGEELVLTADLPGVKPEDLDIRLEANVLTVRAERKQPKPEGFDLLRSERGQLRFSRQIELPVRIDPDGVIAKLENGVLNIHLPKA